MGPLSMVGSVAIVMKTVEAAAQKVRGMAGLLCD